MLSVVSSLVFAASLGLGGDAPVSSPAPGPVAGLAGKVVSLGEIHLCFGTPPAGARCSVTLPVAPPSPGAAPGGAAAAAAPTRFSLLGATICLGDGGEGCDVRLPFGRAPADAKAAKEGPRQGA